MSTRLTLAAITDEYSPSLDVALDAMAESGMTGVELRTIEGRSVIDLTDSELDRIRTTVEHAGMRVLSVASPVFKCTLPGGPPIDPRFQQDVFGSPRTFEDQPALIERSLNAAIRLGATLVRVFSYWRTVDPPASFGAAARALDALVDEATKRHLVIGLENEHACNVATGAETARLLEQVTSPALGVIWDPANALVAGEAEPFPAGYRQIPPARIVHVHVKDCTVAGHTPTWGPIGEMTIDWRGQLRALVADGFRGAVSLETHWKGPRGDKLEASRLSGRVLRSLVDEANAGA